MEDFLSTMEFLKKGIEDFFGIFLEKVFDKSVDFVKVFLKHSVALFQKECLYKLL